ncbi:MAG TPA: hypothetical protein VIE64_07445 [Solirubrobacterales bacterium]|jgi:hypothetical protein
MMPTRFPKTYSSPRYVLGGLSLAVLIAILLAGCGSDGDSSNTTAPEATTSSATPTAPAGATAQSCKSKSAGLEALRVTGIDCGAGRAVATAWTRSASCTREGESRSACTVRGYRCLGVVTERGLALSCAQPGRSVSFVASRD